MRTIRLTAPDGTPWEVSGSRFRLPPWRRIGSGDDLPVTSNAGLDIVVLAVSAVLFAVTDVLVPLAIALVEVPLTLLRSVFSRTVWIEATTWWPHEERFVWRTARADAAVARASVASQLSSGEPLRPPRAELVQRPSRLGGP